MAAAIQDSYSDLFAVNTSAHLLGKQEIVGKLKTLSQGKYSDIVLSNMAMTFMALASLADFDSPKTPLHPSDSVQENHLGSTVSEQASAIPETLIPESQKNVKLGGLVYNIQIVLPETRDPKVYDALFRSLKEHIL